MAKGEVSVRVALDVQDAYDEAIASSLAWQAFADSLKTMGTVCGHPKSMWSPAVVNTPTVCIGCDRVVPGWALERDS